METRAVTFVGVEQAQVVPVEVSAPGVGQLLVRTEVSCVSPGTELRCLRGLERGSDDWPFIPGYAIVGEVIAVGPNTQTPVGQRVYCNGTQDASVRLMWGGHCGLACVTEASVFPVPDGVPSRDAVFAHMAAIAYRGVRMAQVLPTDRVAVIGLGPIGQLSFRLFALTGAAVVGLDPDSSRVELAQRAGGSAIVVGDSLEASCRIEFPTGADVVVDATGVPAVFNEAVKCARDRPWSNVDLPGSRIIVQGSYAREFSVDYPSLFLREATMAFPRDAQPQDFAAMLGLMRRGALNLTGLAGDIVTPEQAPDLYARLLDRTPGLLTALIQW